MKITQVINEMININHNDNITFVLSFDYITWYITYGTGTMATRHNSFICCIKHILNENKFH